MALYEWLVWGHIISIFGFLVSHGGSSMAVFRIKKTAEPEKLKALLELSRFSIAFSYVFILLVLGTGISLAFLGGYWGQLWVWTAIGVGFLTMGLMYPLGTGPFTKLRSALGLPTNQRGKKQEPGPVADPQQIEALARSTRPVELSIVGAVGITVIAWLMVFKPF
ncbi:MAG: hypothetical protein HY247_06435 [archaeon]|nr:MAG: hypothetical protein HY247_06435 [archaeon]